MDAYEYTLAALTLWREAANQPSEGKRAVLHVILNRVADKRWPDTISDVVLQRAQFSCFNSGDPVAYKFPKANDKAWKACRAIVEQPGSDPTNGANHYCRYDIMPPKWADAFKLVARIGDHAFYRL